MLGIDYYSMFDLRDLVLIRLYSKIFTYQDDGHVGAARFFTQSDVDIADPVRRRAVAALPRLDTGRLTAQPPCILWRDPILHPLLSFFNIGNNLIHSCDNNDLLRTDEHGTNAIACRIDIEQFSIFCDRICS